jgi:hypothetical protein
VGQPLASELRLLGEVCESAVGPRRQRAGGDNRDVEVRIRVAGTAGPAAEDQDTRDGGLP